MQLNKGLLLPAACARIRPATRSPYLHHRGVAAGERRALQARTPRWGAHRMNDPTRTIGRRQKLAPVNRVVRLGVVKGLRF